MKLPRGRLVRQRVVTDAGTPLTTALETGFTGYARLESQDSLLLDGDGIGIITFDDGVPTAAYHTGTDSTGAEAIADIAVAGPYRIGLYELDAARLDDVHQTPALTIPAGMPADRLAADTGLVERTREAAPADRLPGEQPTGETTPDGLESFLDDEQRIESIKQRAHEEAVQRAEEWNL